MSKALLQIENLKTSFYTQNGEVQAVRGINLELRAGEALGIVGESGSGKSVMSMSVLRLLPDNAKIKEGKISFNGKVISVLSKKEIRVIRGKDIAMVFQDPMSSLNPLISVGEQVAEMIRIHYPKTGKTEMRSRVLELFHLVKIPEPEKRYKNLPHEFSGGMRQRVMIALALACKPDILIADEPTTALDVTIQAQILKLLANLQKELGMSILFITHDLGVVMQLCSRAIVMYGGMKMEEGSMEDLFLHSRHPYTMGLIRSIPKIGQDKSVPLQPILGSPPDMLNPPAGCPFAPRCPYARKICASQVPPYTAIKNHHFSACWLVTEDAPATNNPFAQSSTTA
ncbi:ABC transporter ATP-binding protein [Clostridiales bacterium COT073_COT-073]|nr:ABC transporter ATP-binding protein [Clostridiales bacterium COT073_COT-073]